MPEIDTKRLTAAAKAAVAEVDDLFDFICPVTDGSCGDRGTGVPFTSSQWPTAALAAARGLQHLEDHLGTPMPELHQFRLDNKLTVDTDGRVSVKDL